MTKLLNRLKSWIGLGAIASLGEAIEVVDAMLVAKVRSSVVTTDWNESLFVGMIQASVGGVHPDLIRGLFDLCTSPKLSARWIVD